MTPRQQKLLSAIVEYYVHTANPVGSQALSKKLGYSSATIRFEMAELEDSGYIMHPHTSAGRIPTDEGYRYYVDSLEKLQLKAEAARVHQAIGRRITSAGEPRQAIKSAVDSLVDVTGNLAVGTLSNNLYMNGLAHLFTQPEFSTIARVHQVAKLLDELEPWLREAMPPLRINVYIGNENPIGASSGCSLIISRFASPYSDHSYVGIIGPTRQSYHQVMRLVGYVGNTLEEAFSEA